MEISLQPWHAFRPDGVILFSDILTPLTGMNIPFDIVKGHGPLIQDPIRTMKVSPTCASHTQKTWNSNALAQRAQADGWVDAACLLYAHAAEVPASCVPLKFLVPGCLAG